MPADDAGSDTAMVVTAAVGPEVLSRLPADRLDRWLAAALADPRSVLADPPSDLPVLSRNRLKSLILDGRVSVDGEVARDPSRRVTAGATIAVTVPSPEPAAPTAQALPLAVIFEDAHLIVVDKPAGLTVHPAPGNPDGTLVNALLAHCGDGLSGIGGVRRPGIVHRIDKDTSGLLVAAKTDAAHLGLAALFATHRIERSYLALTWGVPLPPVGRIETDIGRHPADRKRMAVRPAGRGKHAVTRYKVRERFGETASLVECRLETGRTHQIRVHLAHIGHPLIGDPVYARGRTGRLSGVPESAGKALSDFPRQALHAASLGFTHPVTGEQLAFEADLPDDLSFLLSALRHAAADR